MQSVRVKSYKKRGATTGELRLAGKTHIPKWSGINCIRFDSAQSDLAFGFSFSFFFFCFEIFSIAVLFLEIFMFLSQFLFKINRWLSLGFVWSMFRIICYMDFYGFRGVLRGLFLWFCIDLGDFSFVKERDLWFNLNPWAKTTETIVFIGEAGKGTTLILTKYLCLLVCMFEN